jgi:hypothetical protein
MTALARHQELKRQRAGTSGLTRARRPLLAQRCRLTVNHDVRAGRTMDLYGGVMRETPALVLFPRFSLWGALASGFRKAISGLSAQ